MLTDLQITALLIRADDAVARNEGFSWAPMRPQDVDDMAATIRQLRAELVAAKTNPPLCPSCDQPRAFNISGHVAMIEARGDVRKEFARQLEKQVDAEA